MNTSAVSAATRLYTPVTPHLSTESFEGAYQDEKFVGEIIHLKDSCFIWLGLPTDIPCFSTLVSAVKLNGLNSSVAATSLFCAGSSSLDTTTCETLGSRITVKTGKHTTISCNLPPTTSPSLVKMAEKIIISRLKEKSIQ